jgi:hypothetical protein
MKKGIGIMIALGKKPKEETEPIEGEGEDTETTAFDDAVDSIFEAIKSEDKELFKEALRAAIESCGE